MPYPQLILSTAPPPGEGLSSRADVAVFVGLVRRRATPIPADVRTAIEADGWAGSGPFARDDSTVEQLLDVPVPITSWEIFDTLFAWDERPVAVGSLRRLPCPLGLAVRSFFAEGGAKAWVVRAGDPLPLLADGDSNSVLQAKRSLISWGAGSAPPDAASRVPLIPGFGGAGPTAEPADPGTWRGVAHIWGIEDAAMLALPDLSELFAGPPAPVPEAPKPPPVPEQFKPCAVPAPGFEPEARLARPRVTAPRLDRSGFAGWGAAIKKLLDMLAMPRGAAHRRDVMLITSLPLPKAGLESDLANVEGWPLKLLDEAGIAAPGARLLDREQIGSARLQLAYPWVETAASSGLPDGIEAPEGAVAGAIARTALASGAFRSAAGSLLSSIVATVPTLGTAAIRAGLEDGRADWLGDRLCLIGRNHDGIALISDATMSADRAWRAGGVSRLMGIILRAARALGQDRLFEPAGPALWASIRLDLESLLERLRGLGALAGATADEAYQVRCGQTTMSSSDIDAGRTIASVAFTAAYPIQTIRVTLALGEAGVLPRLEVT